MARNSTKQLGGKYDLESRGFSFSCTSEQESTQLSQASTNVVLCCFLRRWCLLRDFSSVIHLPSSLVFLANYAYITRTNRTIFESNLHP